MTAPLEGVVHPSVSRWIEETLRPFVAEGVADRGRPVTAICERPGCAEPARHRPHIGGDVVDGWRTLCCHHADWFMATCSLTVDRAEAAAGWDSWCAAHEAECGPVVGAKS